MDGRDEVRGGYNSPSSQIFGRVEIGMQRMAAFKAGEVGLSPAIVLISKATTRAGLRGVSWVDDKDGHAGLLGLVGEKLPNLTETPIRLPLPRPLPRANREPAPDVGQVFQHQDGLRVFAYRTRRWTRV
jgi:hypothetical protein